MTALPAVGIDGCRGGWVWCAWMDGRQETGHWEAGLVTRLLDLPAALHLRSADTRPRAGATNPDPAPAGEPVPILIDMPLGLLDCGRAERACDRAARALLGRPRASSVFRAPCRAALDARDYATACAISQAQTGLALSRQTWHLVPKIGELDTLLRVALVAGQPLRLRESHPELCLWGLAGGRAMAHNKRTPPGRAERRALLRQLAPDLLPVIDALLARHRRRVLAADDAIDAAVLALCARLIGDATASQGTAAVARSATVPIDGVGLPMQLWYAFQPPASGPFPQSGDAVAGFRAIF